eukprot:scaffold81933_cov64-Phaeocystis_antarctica.AAC.2
MYAAARRCAGVLVSAVPRLVANGFRSCSRPGASCRRFLHPEDAKRRQKLRARGEACSGHLAQPRRSVGCQLSGRVRRAHIPRGGRGKHGAPLSCFRQIDGRISSALEPKGTSEGGDHVPADDHEVVTRELSPRSHDRVVHAKICAGHGAGALDRWVLELSRSPHHVPSRERLGCTCWARAGDPHTEEWRPALHPLRLDRDHLCLRAHAQLGIAGQCAQIVRVLITTRVLGVRRAVCD